MEDQFIEGLRAGKEGAYRWLFENYYRKLVVFATKYTEDLEVSRDLVQDLFLSIYDSRQQLSIRTSLRSYLYRAVKNRCLNHLKHLSIGKKYTETIIPEVQARDPGLEEEIDAIEMEARIFETVSGLPARCRQIFNMSRIDGKRNTEIARELNLSVRTVETQISKALRSLRDSLLS